MGRAPGHVPWGQAVLIARDNHRRERLNALVRAELRRDGQLGESVHVAGHEFAVGDRVIARRNDRRRAVDDAAAAPSSPSTPSRRTSSSAPTPAHSAPSTTPT